MKLCLSSAALPAGSLGTLASACRRRALEGLELVLSAGHRHGLEEAACPLHEPSATALRVDAPPVRWLLLPREIRAAALMAWASVAHEMGAGLLLQAPADPPPLAVPVALLHGTGVDEAAEAATWAHRHGAATAWDVAPGTYPYAQVEAVCAATGSTLAHVRLQGSGPEAERDDEPGTGQLMAHLALCNYGGTIALAPSPGADLHAWSHWLLHGRGWGCGTAAEKQARALARRAAVAST